MRFEFSTFEYCDCEFDLNMARTKVCATYLFEFQRYVNGHHIYKNIWTPTLAEKLATTTEPENPYDKYAVKVLKESEVVGYIPRDLSKYYNSALLPGGTVECVVIGKKTWK